MKSIKGKEIISHCFAWIWFALLSLFHRVIHMLCLLFHKERVAFESCDWGYLPFTFDPSYQFNLDQSYHCYQSLSQWHTEIVFVLFAGKIKVGTQSITVTSIMMHQATIFLKGYTLSWLTNLLRSTFSSLHCSTWISVVVPSWTCQCLFPLLLMVAPLMPYFPRSFLRSRTTNARNGLLAPRS